jgi:hypothetical protein
MNFLRNIGLVLGLLLLFSGCFKEIFFENVPDEQILVVQGTITDVPSSRTIFLSYTAPFGQQNGERISAAQIDLIDDKGKKWPYVEVLKGRYVMRDSQLRILPGERYFVEIKLANGEAFRSELQKMPRSSQIDDLRLTFNQLEDDRPLRVWADVSALGNQDGTFLRWSLLRIARKQEVDQFRIRPFSLDIPTPKTCYITYSVNEQSILLFGTERKDDFKLKQQELAAIPTDRTFADRNMVQVVQYSLPEAAYQYYRKINTITNQVGTIFDPPPAKVRGNILQTTDPDRIILGYVDLAAVDTAVAFVNPSFFEPVYIASDCMQDFSRPDWAATWGYPATCLNCLLIPGSGTQLPKYWKP